MVILGDMFELGEEAEKEHRLIGQLAQTLGFDKVYLCGTLMKAAKEAFPGAILFENKTLLTEALKKDPPRNATILVKASRGIGLETIVEFL